MDKARQVAGDARPPAKERAHFALRTLGGLTLLGPDGREVESLATRRRKLAVLAWLAMRPLPATRDQVVGVFWGDRDEVRARSSLADALSHFRRVFGRDAVPAFRACVALGENVPLVVDAIALDEAAKASNHARVVELYLGEFLDGVYVDDSVEFERWRDGERFRLARLFVRSAAARCTQLAGERQWEACAALAQRWFDAEPASADAALRLLDALAAPDTHGARVTALTAFEKISERLRQDLGVAPAPAVVERGHMLAAATSVATPVRSRHIVGRAAEQQALTNALASAARGRGSVLCISGEPGIGKTTLVESWLEEVGAAAWVARGRCSERLAGAEAYLPLLDALDSLALPAAPTQERLKRELVALFEKKARSRPVVLFLDDMHWSDSSTVDFVAYLATRVTTMRFLLVVTYREEDMRATRHPFLPLVQELEARSVASTLPLPFFTSEEVARYAQRELPAEMVTHRLVTSLHAQTEGSPLFVAELVRELRERGTLVGELPRSVRSMVRRKLERLGGEDRRLLTIASVQGVEFDAPIVAATAGLDVAHVEERLDTIDRDEALVCRAGERTFADGTVGARYRFVHVLYQNALSGSLGPARQRAINAAVAEALVRHAAGRTVGLDPQLALLYEAADDPARAVSHFTLAGDEAARLFAHREALALWRRALALVPWLPQTPERAATAMRLQFSIGLSTMIVDGYAAPAAREAYAAASELAAGFGDVGQIFPMMSGIFGYYVIAGDVAESARVAARMREMTAYDAPSPFVLMSRLAEGFVQHSRGDQALAHETLERAIALYDPAQHPVYLAIYRMDPGINALAQSARTLWLLGHPDRALERAVYTVDIARRLDHPPSLAFAKTLMAIVLQLRGDAAHALACADETIALCDEHDITQERAWMLPLRGWALAATGQTDDGVALTRKAVAAYVASGAQHTLPYYYTLLAEVLRAAGIATEAVAACDAGLAMSARIGEVAYDAELHRLRGACATKHTLTAQRDFETALRIARAQGCRGYESRAAASLASLIDS